ncbi:response regulator [Histidinibacterium lentulum]|uniref:Response regulator n=1 Tax=Histidinibacterium lentulum TaxID=2480588 RepID=A0A3N2QTL2_9RHOB|nr:response regulator [Histidinibacterium lentulum]ROT98479.1 response regulator [Histidinibacterium lentulum]
MTSLAGMRVLIVEDEMLLAMDLEAVISGWGAEVLGPVPSIDKALALLSDERPDVATLDMNLSGVSSRPLAEEFAARRIPFVVVSGYSEADALANGFVKKPYDEGDLRRALEDALR